MSKKILYFKSKNAENEAVIQKFENAGYVIVEYQREEMQPELEQVLTKDFFYFVLSFEFDEELSKACSKMATKYVIWLRTDEKVLYESMRKEGMTNCYFFLQTDDSIEKADELIFCKEELDIYHIINQLDMLHKKDREPIRRLEDLGKIEDNEEAIRLTDYFFDEMEAEKKLSFQLKEQLLEYIDALLKKKTKDAWQEITLWNKRHECRQLMNRFWQFYLLQKAAAIYAEEMVQYYNCGEEPSVIRLESFKELYEVYFQLLFLLRRLEYNIAPEEESHIVRYVLEKKVSAVFVRHVIEHNQIENKEKVYRRFKELLTKYE